MVEVLEAVRAAAPGLALGVRLSADSAAARAVVGELAPLVDFVHVAVGNSATFDGCSGIVPPPPAPRNLIAGLTGPFRLGRPLIATTRVVEPADADEMIARGVADAVGHEPRADHRSGHAAQGARGPRARGAALHRLQHVHRPLPRGHGDPLRAEPAHGAGADVGARLPADAAGLAWWSSAPGRRDSRRRPRRRPPAEVVVLEREARSAGRCGWPGGRRRTASSRRR